MTFRLPSPQDINELYPLSKAQRSFISQSRNTVKEILSGKDHRTAVIVGPCSIHSEEATLEYGRRLALLSKEISHKFFIVMRAYLDKPRTSLGWKGFINDPYLDGSYDILYGLKASRNLLCQLSDLKLPLATEILDPFYYHYFIDVITWAMIGARTSQSQPHRQIASALPCPTGFKNSPEGNISAAINGVISANTPHTFPSINQQGDLEITSTQGNKYAHIVLRGGDQPNCEELEILQTSQNLKSNNLPPNVIIDCSHANCAGDYLQQTEIFKSLMKIKNDGNNHIKGMMLESNLKGGSKTSPPYSPDISIIDPCLSWEETESLLKSF